MKRFLAFFLFVFCNMTWAKGACPDSGSMELARVRTATPGLELLACGTRRGLVHDLTVYRVDKAGSKDRILDGDAAVKTYRLTRAGSAFDVEESLNRGGFRPFIKTHVACDGEACAARDTICLWKKRRSLDESVVAKIQQATAPVSDEMWTQAFTAALNGSASARALFEGQGLKDPTAAEHSEWYSTHRADLVRLKALGCLASSTPVNGAQ